MPSRLEVEVRRGDVSKVIALIAQFSHATYEKLPLQYRSWWSVEDLIAYGTNHAVTHVVKLYKQSNPQGAQFITYLYKALENLYKDLIEEAYADKRKAAVFSADSQSVMVSGHQRNLLEVVVRSLRHTQTEEETVSRIDAEKSFLQVYSAASAHLRKYLINWCIQPKVTKYKLTGKQFRLAVKEFQVNKFGEVLTSDSIRTIQNDVLCRNRVCLALLYKTGAYTYRYRTQVKEGKPSLEESLIAPILQ